MGPYELLQKVVTAFEELNIRYIVTGSVASIHQKKRFKVQRGRMVHENKVQVNPDYLRKKLTKYKARCGDCCYRNICEKVI